MIGTLDKGIIIIYLSLLVILGIFLGKSNKDQEDYFVGGRDFKWWTIGLSVIATQVSAVTFIGAPGWAYQDGLSAIILTLNIPLVMVYVGSVLHPFFYNSGSISIYEYLEKRFGPAARAVMVFGFLFKSLIVFGTILYAPALVLSAVTGLSINLTIAIIAVIGIFYTILGGIKAVIWTDVIQMIILWVGLILSIIIVIKYLPTDLSETMALIKETGKLKALDFSLGFDKSNTVWAGLIGGTVLHLSYFGVDQSQVQRVLTAKSMKHVKYSLWFSGVILVVQMFLFMLLGCMLFVYFDGATFGSPNDIFITFALEKIPTGLLGIIIAAIFAAAMSSLDSALNSMSTVFVKDIYERWINKDADDEALLKISRRSTFVCGILVAAFAFLVSNSNLSILEAISKYGSYLYGSMLSVFLLGMYSKKVNEKGVTWGFIIGVAVVAYVAQNLNVFWMWNNLIGVTVTAVSAFIISALTGHEKKDIELLTIQGQKKFFKKENKPELEGNVYVVPGKFEKLSYGLLGYFVLVLIIFYILGM